MTDSVLKRDCEAILIGKEKRNWQNHLRGM